MEKGSSIRFQSCRVDSGGAAGEFSDHVTGQPLAVLLRRGRGAIPMTTRRLAAIVAADVVGYGRLMGIDELGTLEALKGHRRALVDPAIGEHHGRIVKT